MDALQLRDVIGVGNVDWAEILCAEASEALLSDGNADFFDAVDVRDFGENLFLFGIEREDGEIFGIENAEDFFMQVKENVVEIAGRMDLVRDAFDVLGECHFLLKFLKILWDGIGLHSDGLLAIDDEGVAGSVCSMKSAYDPRDHPYLESANRSSV